MVGTRVTSSSSSYALWSKWSSSWSSWSLLLLVDQWVWHDETQASEQLLQGQKIFLLEPGKEICSLLIKQPCWHSICLLKIALLDGLFCQNVLVWWSCYHALKETNLGKVHCAEIDLLKVSPCYDAFKEWNQLLCREFNSAEVQLSQVGYCLHLRCVFSKLGNKKDWFHLKSCSSKL